MMQKTIDDRQLKVGMIWNSFGSLAYFGCQWLTTILVVRLAHDYSVAGDLALAMSIANIFTPFALFRMRTYQVSDVAEAYSTRDYMGFRLTTCAIALFVCTLYSIATCPLESLAPIFVFLLFKTTEQIIDVLNGLDQKVNRLDIAGKSLLARAATTLVSFCSIFFVTQNLTAALIGEVIASALVGVIYDAPKAAQFDIILPIFNIKRFTELTRECGSVVLASVAAGAVMTLPKQQLGSLLGQEALGLYSSIASPLAIIQLGASYLYGPLMGKFAEYYLKKNKKGFMKVLRISILGIVALGVISIVVLSPSADFILGLLFGEEASEHAYLVTPMIVCTTTTAFFLFSSDLLLSIRETKINAITGFAALAIASCASTPLIHELGMNAVNVTGVVSYGIAFLVNLLAVASITSKIDKE